jgi:hypothetical protein
MFSLLIDGIGAQMIGIGLFWLIQKRWKIPTKTMLLAVGFFILVLCSWGCIGITQRRFGYVALGMSRLGGPLGREGGDVTRRATG